LRSKILIEIFPKFKAAFTGSHAGNKPWPKSEAFCNKYQTLKSWMRCQLQNQDFLVHSAEMPRFHSGSLSRDPGSISRETGRPKIPNFPGIPVPGIPVPGIPGRKLYLYGTLWLFIGH